MSARKSERIMNLTICLLMAGRFIGRDQIRALVEGYAGLSDAAFERTFERDKDDLRALGVPVETGSNDPLFPDEVGYRIRRTDFELPALHFDAAETAALGIAAGVWDSARVGGSAVHALAKLRAAGLDPDASRVDGFAPTLGAREPAFEPLWEATLSRTPMAFRYRGLDRVVEPWTLTYRTGAWYLVGYDRVRAAGRSFKLSRFEDAPRPAGCAGSYDVPEASVIETHLASLEPVRSDREVLVAVREGAAPALVRYARSAERAAPRPGFSTWWVRRGSAGDAGEWARHGADVIVLEPPELVAAVREHLAAVSRAWS